MNTEKKTGIVLGLLVLVEYTLGALVTFSDPSNAGFSISSFPTTYPAYLPLVHRIFALVLIASWIILPVWLRGTRAFIASHITLGLIVLQSIIGLFIPYTLGSQISNYVVIVHFSVSGLIIAAAGFTVMLAWLSDSSAGMNKEHKQPGEN